MECNEWSFKNSDNGVTYTLLDGYNTQDDGRDECDWDSTPHTIVVRGSDRKVQAIQRMMIDHDNVIDFYISKEERNDGDQTTQDKQKRRRQLDNKLGTYVMEGYCILHSNETTLMLALLPLLLSLSLSLSYSLVSSLLSTF
jgi:hypothetical protein